MKIAILGNMNNNGFALLRYLRDEGVDAELILFADDGAGVSAHFSIQADTWNLDRWYPYIRQIDIKNNFETAVSAKVFYRWVFKLANIYRVAMGHKNVNYSHPIEKQDRTQLVKLTQNYDVFIGSGSSPALFESLGLQLSIFFPYSIGIEFINEPNFSRYKFSKNPFARFLALEMYRLQSNGIQKCKYVITADDSERTKKSIIELGIKPLNLTIPIVYPYDQPRSEQSLQSFQATVEQIKDFEFVVMCHSRHLWSKKPQFSESEWKKISKHTEWLIQGFANFLLCQSEARSALILFEYGDDWQETKALVESLGIEESVIWVPLMARREILSLIEYCNVGATEFYEDDVFPGGAAWEYMAIGKQVLNGPFDSDKQFKQRFGYPPPPLRVADSAKKITAHLIDLYENLNRCAEEGNDLKLWFEKYNGHVAVRKIIDLL